MSISPTLSIARDALLVQQRAIQVAGHNIANVNTPGYSRQRLLLETKTPRDTYSGQIGTGVQSVTIERIVDQFLSDQMNDSAHDMGRWEAQRDTLERVEIVFDETTGYGLNDAMGKFWNAWQGMENSSLDAGARNILLAASVDLTNTFNSIYGDLENIQNDIDSNISASITEVNRLALQISDFNSQIRSVEATGQNANDFRDQRDQLLLEMSEYIDFTSSENVDGVVTITLGDGNDLVDPTGAFSLSVNDTDSDGFQDVVWSSAPATAINSNISSGKLKGWLEVRDVIIPGYLAELNTLAGGIINSVNTVHLNGYGIVDATQRDFFSGSDASDISVNNTILTDPNHIAASTQLDPSTGAGEDNNYLNAGLIADLQTSLTMNGNTATFDDYYNSVVANVGLLVDDASQYYDHQESMSAHLSNYRESVSGVSLDEEMVNLIKFQHAYDAAAKLITTVDELLDTLINSIR